MKLYEIRKSIHTYHDKLTEIYEQYWHQALVEIGGDWTEPEKLQKIKDRTEQLADERLKNVEFNIIWKENNVE
jgi:hypothetical protein